MQIVKYPDPILRRTTETVTVFDGELEKIAKQMLDTMYTLRGVGLAAPQVGLATALLVLTPPETPRTQGKSWSC